MEDGEIVAPVGSDVVTVVSSSPLPLPPGVVVRGVVVGTVSVVVLVDATDGDVV